MVERSAYTRRERQITARSWFESGQDYQFGMRMTEDQLRDARIAYCISIVEKLLGKSSDIEYNKMLLAAGLMYEVIEADWKPE